MHPWVLLLAPAGAEIYSSFDAVPRPRCPLGFGVVPVLLSLWQQLELRSQEDSPKPWISNGIWLLGEGGAWPAPYHWQWARSACL